MSKTLEVRLRDAKAELGKAKSALARHGGSMPAAVEEHFREIISSGDDIEHWIGMIHARTATRRFLDGLEAQADADDLVAFGAARVRYQHVRLIGVQAYLATSWALADRVAGMVGGVLCTPDAGSNASRPAQLVTHFVQDDRKTKTTCALHKSVRLAFGWPIAVSYALRNHFVHEGGQVDGVDFFEGPTAGAGFAVSAKGWARLEDRARGHGVLPSQHRAGPTWPLVPRDDLRLLLDACERETDDALGVLVGLACRSMVAHIGYLVGED